MTDTNKLKINQIKQYLDAGYNVTECAEMLGYNDPYYFSKLFKQYEGVLPSYYGEEVI